MIPSDLAHSPDLEAAMTRCSKLLTLLPLFCGLLAPGALAQDQTSQSGVDEQGSLPSLEEIDRTTIVWLREGVAQEAVREQFVRRKVEVMATFPELNGFAVR